jgi:hypothetical protein
MQMARLDGTLRALVRLLGEVEALLKQPTIGFELGHRGVNTSVALLATQGLAAYLEGNKRQAADDLATAAEEIRSRLEAR